MEDEREQTDEAYLGLRESAGAFRARVRRSIKATGRRLLPQKFIREVRRYRSYAGVERWLYLKMRLLNGIGLVNPKRSQPPKTARSFVFVCYGNIVRSPMCEALMKRAVTAIPDQQITVASAGLNAAPGRPAHPWAVAAAQELGISLESHRAQLLTAEMVTRADVIFAMDYENQAQLLTRYSEAKDKVFMLGAYAREDHRPIEIHDPYYVGETGTRDCYKILDTCIRNLANSLSGE